MAKKQAKKTSISTGTIAKNKKAYFNFEIVEKFAEGTNGTFKVPEILCNQAALGTNWDLSSVSVKKDGMVAVIRINRPEAMNALNSKVLSDLARAVMEVEEDDEIRAVIVTGEGTAFVAGADIREMLTKTPLEARKFTQLGQSVFKRIENLSKPVIAAVNGFALGGGAELALACDFIIASTKAKFGLPEVGLGIHPGFGGTQRLPRTIGKAKAKELIYTGKIIDAAEAERIGLVNRVVGHTELFSEAKKVAKIIAAKGPIAVALAKSTINKGFETDLNTALAYETESVSLTFSTEDKNEGMSAFVEKRKPEFKGK